MVLGLRAAACVAEVTPTDNLAESMRPDAGVCSFPDGPGHWSSMGVCPLFYTQKMQSSGKTPCVGSVESSTA